MLRILKSLANFFLDQGNNKLFRLLVARKALKCNKIYYQCERLKFYSMRWSGSNFMRVFKERLF
jgi:hypothetical protein